MKHGIKAIVFAIIILMAVCGVASAISYKDEPYFSAYISGSNHVEKGGDSQLFLVIQNNAILRETIYYDYTEYLFFQNRTEMLTTAYNVSIEFEGSDGIEVLTPPQSFAAIPAMQPIQIPVKIRVNDSVEAGEYELKLKIKYEILDHVFLNTQTYQPPYTSVLKETQTVYEYVYNNSTGIFEPSAKRDILINESVLPEYWFDYIKFKFKEKEQTITLKVVVDEGDVRLEIVNIQTEDMIAGGKGKLTLTIKNTGEKEAKNLFVVLATPSGFTTLTTMQEIPSADALQPLLTLIQMQSMLSRTSVELPELSVPPELAALLVKGAYYVGDLKPDESVNVTFIVDITTDEPGYYPFQIRGVYLDEYGETKQTSNVAFGVKVEEGVDFEVVNTSSSVYAGSKGDFVVDIKLTRAVENLRVKLEVQPPLTAIVSETYIGDVDDACEAKFKVKASGDAEQAVYPAKLKLTYSLGDKEQSEELDVGIVVHPKMKFELEGKGVIPAGEEKIVTVTIRNAGAFTIKDATARITVVDPFSTTDDTAYIGNLEPGEAKNVSFKIKVDDDATPKTYALNLEVKYRDPSDEWVISDPVKMPIEVVEYKGIPKGLLYGLLIAAVIAGAAIYNRVKKNQ